MLVRKYNVFLHGNENKTNEVFHRLVFSFHSFAVVLALSFAFCWRIFIFALSFVWNVSGGARVCVRFFVFRYQLYSFVTECTSF